MAINKDQIIRAADKLEASGIKVTMASVREALGTGSFGTISPVLRERRLAKEKLLLDKSEIPAEASAALEKLGSEVWKLSKSLAEESALKVYIEFSDSSALKSTERHEFLQEIDELERHLKMAQEKIEIIDEQMMQYKISLGSMESSLVDKKEELKELRVLYEKQSVHCSLLQFDIAKLEKDLLSKDIKQPDEDDSKVDSL